MPLSHTIIKRYASAYMKCEEEGIEKKLENLKKIVDITSNYKLYLVNPAINLQIKYEILRKILPNELLKTPAFNLTMLLIRNKRFDLLPLIYDECLDISLRAKGRIRVKVLSRYPLNDAQIRLIEEFFKTNLALNAVITWHQDKNLIGGFLIRWDDKMIDATVDLKLEKLKKTLLTTED